jgi:hypothetical protein
MKICIRRRLNLGRHRRLLLLLCLGLIVAGSGFPLEGAATGSRVSVIQAVSQDKLPVLEMKVAPSPVTLQDFVRLTVGKLAAETPFQDWKDAETEYYPLGPGTHSWLVNVMSGGQRVGYMIISAADTGGYMLSEYGAGTYGLPYSLNDLRQFLVQEGLIASSYSGKLELTALYAPLLPVWKISINGKTVYINASVPQILPWSLSKAEAVLEGRLADRNLVTSRDSDFSPRSAYRSGGSDDPYKDLQWLTSPKLPAVSADSFAAQLAPGRSIAFQAAGRNDALGAPFMITGYQSWQPDTAEGNKDGGSNAASYAASGREGKRYLPLSALQDNGTLHNLPGE